MTNATLFSTLYTHTAVWKEHNLFTNFAPFISSIVHLQKRCSVQLKYILHANHYLLDMNHNIRLCLYILHATCYLVIWIWSPLYVLYTCVFYIQTLSARHATNILMTFWMIWPHPGHGAWHLCSFRAQGKQVSMCAVRPWMMLPSRGRTRHNLQGSSMTSRASWLSWELWTIRRGALPLADAGEAGNSRDTQCEGRMTGSETVLGQSGTSMPSSSSSFSSLESGRSGTETECARRVQSLYQSLRRAQQRMQ